MGTYVYCLIAAPRVPPLKGAGRGLPAMGPLRLLAVDDGKPRPALKKWLAVSDAPAAQYGAAAINRHLSDIDWVSRAAIAHERVVESFIDQPAVVPMKLFTIFNDDARALAHVAGERRRIEAAVDRVKGHHEWGMRVALDAGAARSAKSRAGARAGIASGAAYLSLKKSQRDWAAERTGRAQATVAGLYDRLEAVASAAKRRAASELPPQGGPLLLDAAFLVRRTRATRFRAMMARESKTLAPQGYQIMVTGPWPPYSFLQD